MSGLITSRSRARNIFASKRFPQKPSYPGNYLRWLEDQFDYRVDNFGEADYSVVTGALKASFVGSEFWQDFEENIRVFDRSFRYQTGAFLFQTLQLPSIRKKEFKSFLRKTYHFNVRENDNFPSPPNLGWVSPQNWYEKVNDTVRTQVVTRHMDGALFLVQKLRELAQRANIWSDVKYRAYDDGYYAIHFYVRLEAKALLKSRARYQTISGQIELQITTQLQETIKQLLHRDYRKKRRALRFNPIPWQWRYQDHEFLPNFLGHSLQNIDGIICRFHT